MNEEYVKEKCPHCGHNTFINRTVCMSCGYGFAEKPILKKGAADIKKKKKKEHANPT